jgi:hypothetical protein
MTTVITGEDNIHATGLLVARRKLMMEIKGIRFKGRSTSSVLKQRFDFRGRTKADILAQLEAKMTAMGIPFNP